MIRNIKKLLYIKALIILAGIYISGCTSTTWLNKIPIGEVQKIKPGKTTKREIFEKLAFPKAIVAKDEVSRVPAERIASRETEPPFYEKHTRLAYYKIDSDTLFELFSKNHQLTEYHRLYYYSDSILRTGFSRGRFDLESRLWILINEKTSIVEDYIFRQHYNVRGGKGADDFR